MKKETDFTTLARNLRKRSTDAERLLWKYLRNRQLDGLKFRRQEPMGQYIVDFVCFEKRNVVEVDGGQHQERADIDRHRDDFLKTQGFSVVRFWNTEVLRNPEGVLNRIREISSERQIPSP